MGDCEVFLYNHGNIVCWPSSGRLPDISPALSAGSKVGMEVSLWGTWRRIFQCILCGSMSAGMGVVK